MAKEAEAGEMKSQVQNAIDKEHQLRESLRTSQMGVGNQMRDLQNAVNEMKVEKSQWMDQKNKYERDFQTMAHSLQDVKNALQQSQLKYQSEKDKLATEVRALNSTLEQERAAWRVKENSLTEELKGKSSASENDVANLRKQLEIVQVQAKSHLDAQAQAFKYRLQYLEMSSRNFQEEKKKWNDKEHLYEEKLNEMAYQISELKHEHSQAVNVHLAYKSHVEAKLKSREAQDAIWQVKMDGLKTQSQVEKVNLEGQLKQVQSQLELANRRYQKAEQDVSSLREQLAQAQSQSHHFGHDPYGLQSPGFNASMGLSTPKTFMGYGAGMSGMPVMKPTTPYGLGLDSKFSSAPAFTTSADLPVSSLPATSVTTTPRTSFAPKTPLGMNGVNGVMMNGTPSPPALSVNVDSSSPRHSIQPEFVADTSSQPISASPARQQTTSFSPVASPHLEAPGDRISYSDNNDHAEYAALNGAPMANGFSDSPSSPVPAATGSS